MNGVYVPFWTFDADTASRYTGQRGEYYYETRTVTVVVNPRRTVKCLRRFLTLRTTSLIRRAASDRWRRAARYRTR